MPYHIGRAVPVASTSGFVVSEKIPLGYGATYPAVGRGLEQYEVATIGAVGLNVIRRKATEADKPDRKLSGLARLLTGIVLSHVNRS